MRFFYVLILLSFTLYSKLYSQHYIRTNQPSRIFGEIKSLNNNFIQFSYPKSSKKYVLDRKFVNSIGNIGFDPKIIRQNYNLENPYILDNLKFDDEISFNNYPHYTGLSINMVYAKVLSISDDSIEFVFKIDDKILIDKQAKTNIQVIVYSDESKNFHFKKFNNSGKDYYITLAGDKIEGYIYSLGNNGFRFSELKVEEDIFSFDPLSLETITNPDINLRLISHNNVLRVSLYDKVDYFPFSKENQTPKAASKSLRIPILSKIDLNILGGSGKNFMLSSPFNFQNYSSRTGYSESDNTYSTYLGWNSQIEINLNNKLSLTGNYSRLSSNTASLTRYEINELNRREYFYGAHYQNNLTLFEYGISGKLRDFFINVKAGRVKSSSQIKIVEQEYKNFELINSTTINGLYFTKPNTTYSIDVGYELNFKNVLIRPQLSYQGIKLENESIEITDITSNNSDYDQVKQAKYSILDEEINGIVDIPKYETINLFSLELQIGFRIRKGLRK